MHKTTILMMGLLLIVLALAATGCSPSSDIRTIETQTTDDTTENTTAVAIIETTEATTGAITTEASIYDSPFKPLTYEVVRAYPNLSFEQPLFLTHQNDMIYVVEKTGKIKFFTNDPTVSETNVFIDLGKRIDSRANEKGLLGFAFHPNYAENGQFFVYYTNTTGSVIARYTRDTVNPEVGNFDSEEILLTYAQPYDNHNGGHIEFGPDGFLYIASGDGGSGGDPQNNAQNKASFLGKILRIDVDQTSGDKTYGIPMDNPFIGNSEGFKEEIFAYGLRNPWRFNFDLKRDLLIAADVGQNKMEEINLIANGGNYGWNVFEGTLPYKSNKTIDKATLIAPVWSYNHPTGKSITGGYTYYGNENPSLFGTYLYADFISGRIWGLWIDADNIAQNYELLRSDLMVSSFGLAPENEVIIVDYLGGLYKLKEVE